MAGIEQSHLVVVAPTWSRYFRFTGISLLSQEATKKLLATSIAVYIATKPRYQPYIWYSGPLIVLGTAYLWKDSIDHRPIVPREDSTQNS